MIQIRDVPDELYRRAVAAAAFQGIALSDLALRALEREVRFTSVGEITSRVRDLGPVHGAPSAADAGGARRPPGHRAEVRVVI